MRVSPAKLPMSTAPKPFDYTAFIDELSGLRESFSNPPPNHRCHDSSAFKLWQHRVIDLIDRIEEQGYRINCGIRLRRFRVLAYAPVSPAAQQKAFDGALAQTMIELDTIISNFEKYGVSPPAPALAITPSRESTSGQPLEWNKEATLGWYLKHTPARTLRGFVASVLSLVVGAFLFGMYVEKRWPEARSITSVDKGSKVVPLEQTPAASRPESAASE